LGGVLGVFLGGVETLVGVGALAGAAGSRSS